jgi:probable F420-dependent oxidoreductase
MDLGRFGIWSSGLRLGDPSEVADAAAELDELGFGTVWLPGRGSDIFERAGVILAATTRLKVATAIVSIWSATPTEVAAGHEALAQAFPGRFVLGLGISHAPIVDREEAGRYTKPFTRMGEYLDELDALPNAVPRDERLIAAIYPKMLALSAERTLGTHPYLVPPEHSREAREILGPTALLAPEQSVVLESDPERARAFARHHLNNPYMGLPNYTRNWLKYGLDESDLLDGGSDRLVDSIVAWGGIEQLVDRVGAHHAAGADHVCLQVLQEDRARIFRDEWRMLAEALL